MSDRLAAVFFPFLFVLAMVVVGLTLACSGPDRADDPATGGTRLTEVHSIGDPLVVGNLTVWPVFTDEPVDLGEFATLAEAMKAGLAEVREVGGNGGGGGAQRVARIEEFDVEIASDPWIGEPAIAGANDNGANDNGLNSNRANNLEMNGSGATVGTLVIENRGDVPLLVCAGTIVKGGNQDRQIGEDMIIQAGATVPVEAFCVEQGRWANQRMGTVTDGKFVVSAMNATNDVREKAQYEKAQGEVWNEVAATKEQWRVAFRHVEATSIPRAENARAVEGSSSLAVVLDANREVSGKELAALRQAVREHFARHGAGAVGFAYAVDGRVVSVRAFMNDEVFARQFGPFLESMIAEALIARQGKPDAPAVAAKTEDVVALVASIEDADEETSMTRGSNLNGIRMNDHGYNGNCYLPVQGRKVAVTRDWSAK